MEHFLEGITTLFTKSRFNKSRFTKSRFGCTYVYDWALYRRGKRMKRPLNSSMEAYKIMKDCWNNDPLHRPTFSDLVKDFEHLLTIAKECNYLQMSETFERPLADKGGKYKYTY